MTDLDVWPYTLPLKSPWITGRTRTTVRQGFIVQVGGSFGDASPLPGAPTRQLQRISEQLAGTSKPDGPARNALLQAALSEKAREAKMPLGALLGDPHGRKPRTHVSANATIPVLRLPSTVSRAKALVNDGYRTLKLKLSAATTEWKRVEAVRNAVGPDIRLRLDPNGSWRRSMLESRLDRLEPSHIEYVEEPFTPSNPKQFLESAARSPIPFAPDETAASLGSIQSLLADGILEFVILKPMILGGPDVAVEAIELVEEAGAAPIVTDVLESGVGRAGALHVASLTRDAGAAHGLAGGTSLRRDLVRPSLVPKRAQLRVPTRPGLGVTVRRQTS